MRDYKTTSNGTPTSVNCPPFNFIWNKTAATVTAEFDGGKLELRQGEKVKLETKAQNLRVTTAAEAQLVIGSGWME